MRSLVLSLFVAAGMSAPIFAQGNLRNGDFESWGTGSTPVDWNVGNPTVSTYTQSPSTHCGDWSAHVAAGSNWSEFGKQWWFNNAGPVETLQVRFRIKYDSPASGAIVKATCGAYDGGSPWPKPLLAGSESVVVQSSANWQEFVLSYAPPASHNADTLVRFWVTIQNGNGESYLLDSVDFAGSGNVYGSIAGGTRDECIARQVLSSELSLVYDELNRTIRDLREVGDDGDGDAVAIGANWLIDDSNPNPTRNALFNTVHRTSLTSNTVYTTSKSSSFGLDVSPTSVPGVTGWNLQSTVGSLFDVSVDIYASDVSPEIFFVPDITRDPNLMLERFECPNLYFNVDQDNDSTPDDMALITPRAGGALHPLDTEYFTDMVTATAGTQNPGKSYQSSGYPGSASVQMTALYRRGGVGDDFGIAMQARDETMQEKNFWTVVHSTSTIAHGVELGVHHKLPSAMGSGISSDVPEFVRVLAPFRGDWRGAAENYRDWIRTTKLWADAATRQTAPWTKDRPVVFEAGLRPQGINTELVPIANWTPLMDLWSQTFQNQWASGAMQPLFRDFEQHGTYMGPYYEPLTVLSTTRDPVTQLYLPLHQESTILQEWKTLKGKNHSPMAMVAGLRWAKNRTGAPALCDTLGGNPAGSGNYWQYAYDVANVVGGTPWVGVVAEDRNLAPDLTDVPAGASSWQYSYYTMDPRHSFARQTHSNLAAKMAGGGMRLYLFDQWHGAAVPDNFDPAYPASERGSGDWKGPAARRLLADALSAGRAASDDGEFEISMEDPTEIAIDLMSIHGTRPDNIRSHPAPPHGDAESVPVFSHVFNEVVSMTTWDHWMATDLYGSGGVLWWPSSPPGLTASDVQQRSLVEMARTLNSSAFMTFGPLAWMIVNEFNPSHTCGSMGSQLEPTPAKMDMLLIDFLKSCVRTTQGPGKDFFNTGMMVQANGIAGLGTTQVKLAEGSNLAIVDQPRVHHSAFELPGGRLALVLANAELNGGATVTLPTSLGSNSLGAFSSFNLYTNGASSQPTAHTLGMQLAVPPRTVYLLVF